MVLARVVFLRRGAPQSEKISDQTQVTGRFLGGQGLDETRNQARRAFVLTHLETWCQVNFL